MSKSMSKNFLSSLNAMDDDAMDYEGLMAQLGESRRLLHLYEIDNKALKARCEVADDKNEVLKKEVRDVETQIDKLQDEIKKINIDRAFLREEVAQAKLYTVKLQEMLDLKQRSDKARLRSWDVFKSLYTLESHCTELNFVNQRIDCEGALIVADTLDVFSSLQTLNLSDNLIAAKGMEALSISLSEKTSLTTLTMNNNKLGDESMGAVSVVLNRVPLTSLSLSLCKITCEGAALIVDSLSENMPAAQYLTSLNLSQNLISAKGSQAIAQALLRNTTLRMLNLADNQVGDYGMLRINNGITDLNLSNNDLRETGVRELCSSVVENEKLRNIRLVNNAKMGTEGTKALTALQKSMALTRKLRVYF